MDQLAQIALLLVNLGVSLATLAIALVSFVKTSEQKVEQGFVLPKSKAHALAQPQKRKPIAADDFKAWQVEQEEIKRHIPL